MIQIHNTSARDLKSLVEHHFNKLSPVVENAIDRHAPNKQRLYLKKNLRKIITGVPAELIRVHGNYKRFCAVHNTTANSGIKKAFSYDNFLKRKSYDIYDLAAGLKVNVCPYCNRQYTFTIISKSKKITRPEFDHFFSQENYPLLSLSFYNLIPSCVICNSRLKGRSRFSLRRNIHPYLYGFKDDLKFNYHPININGACGLTDEITIKLEIRNNALRKKLIQNNCRIFHLNDIYKEHKDIVREIIRKHYISGGEYLKTLAKSFPKIFTSAEELYQMAFGNYYAEIDFHKRPLGKITRDIFEQLKFDAI